MMWKMGKRGEVHKEVSTLQGTWMKGNAQDALRCEDKLLPALGTPCNLCTAHVRRKKTEKERWVS